jgi:transcriptional regulator with XRE-family HTH domain
MGLSQSELAARAGVSLATVQNVEAGKANPELSTLQTLLAALGMELQLIETRIDWDSLSQVGVPLTGQIEHPVRVRATPENLRHVLSRLSSGLGHLSRDGRERKALVSFLWALKNHFPSFWDGVDQALHDWLRKNQRMVSAKLARIATARLAEYL